MADHTPGQQWANLPSPNWIYILSDTYSTSEQKQYFYADVELEANEVLSIGAWFAASDVSILSIYNESQGKWISLAKGNGKREQIFDYQAEIACTVRLSGRRYRVHWDRNTEGNGPVDDYHYGEYMQIANGEVKKVYEPDWQYSYNIPGLAILNLPPITKPPMRTDIVEIPGRTGDIVTELGYGAYDRRFTIGLYGGYDINQIMTYFSGTGKVMFSNEPNVFYEFRIDEQVDYAKLASLKRAVVTMHVQPLKQPVFSQDTYTRDSSFEEYYGWGPVTGTSPVPASTVEDGVITETGLCVEQEGYTYYEFNCAGQARKTFRFKSYGGSFDTPAGIKYGYLGVFNNQDELLQGTEVKIDGMPFSADVLIPDGGVKVKVSLLSAYNTAEYAEELRPQQVISYSFPPIIENIGTFGSYPILEITAKLNPSPDTYFTPDSLANRIYVEFVQPPLDSSPRIGVDVFAFNDVTDRTVVLDFEHLKFYDKNTGESIADAMEMKNGVDVRKVKIEPGNCRIYFLHGINFAILDAVTISNYVRYL